MTQKKDTKHYLLKRGVMVRPLNAYNMDEYLRITIGQLPDITQLLSHLKAALTDM